MKNQMKINDIANDLFILNKHTVETLLSLENCADCIAMYVFFYKTAKWQETNSIKANETYIKKCLGWGYDKIRRTKSLLKDAGLINVVQLRKDNKIEGWFIQVSYLVSQEKSDKITVINNEEKQEVGNPTSREQEINALKYNINILENNINMLKEENNILKNKLLEKENIIKEKPNNNFDEIYDYWNQAGIYHHREKTPLMLKSYNKAIKDYGLDNEQIKIAIDHYKTMLNDKTCWLKQKWSLAQFLKQDNACVNLTDEGSFWVNYNSPKIVKQGLVNAEIVRPKRDDNDII